MRSFEFALKTGVEEEIKAFPDAQLPEYQTARAAGADFFCAEEVVIPSIWKGVAHILAPTVLSKVVNWVDSFLRDGHGFEEVKDTDKLLKPTLVHTGIKAQMNEDEVLELYNRSSNPKKLGLILANGVGVVDSDYYGNQDNDGEIMFAFFNFKPWDVTIHAGDRIGQGVFKQYLRPQEGLRIKDDERVGGFGSTGGR